MNLQNEPAEAVEVLPRFRKTAIRPFDCVREAGRLVSDQYLLFVAITTVGFLLGAAVPMGLLMGPMLCGFYFCFRERTEGRQVDFVQLFKGFEVFVQATIAYLIQVGVALVAIFPAGLAALIGFLVAIGLAESGAPAPLVAGTLLLATLAGLFLAALWLLAVGLFIFAHQLILDRGLTALEAVRCSIQAAWANAYGIVGLLVLTTTMTLVAAFFCYLPMFFVLPLVFGAYWTAYRRVFLPEGSEPAPAAVA